MGLNDIVVRKKENIKLYEEKKQLFTEIPAVTYALVDSSRYSFEYKVNDEVDVNMVESDRVFDSDEFIDADFDNDVNEVDYSYYAIAVSSGILTGVLSQLNLFQKKLDNINGWKDKDWNNYVVCAAQMAGYKKNDYSGACAFLKDRIISYVDDSLKSEVQESFNQYLAFLSNHPSIAGLAFSILSQYSEKRYSFSDKGIKAEPVPKYYAIGRNHVEKLAYGFLYWVFNLGIDTVVSKRNILDDIKIPREVTKLLKELYKLPLFDKFPHGYNEAEKLYSQWIKIIFEKSKYQDEQGEIKNFDLKDVIQKLEDRCKNESLPIIVNECIVRCFYLIKKLVIECKEKQIHSFKEFEKIEVENVLPFNNRLVSKMILISSGCFMGVNIAGATVKAITAAKAGKRDFKDVLLAEISVAGVGRFVFAVIADSKYWSDDIQIILQRREKNKKVNKQAEEEKIIKDMMSNDAFNVLALTPAQTRALYSLETLVIKSDIEHTTSVKDKELKQKWLKSWQDILLAGMGVDSDDYFVADEKIIYDSLYALEQNDDNLRWFYLMTLELSLFTPYYQLGTKEDPVYKKLKTTKYDYLADRFIRKQTIVSQAEIDTIKDVYKKYRGIVSGSTKNTALAAGVITIAAVATGGMAYAFAPGIATMIAGDAVVGLHGAALVNASLAFVGGGSLAAGGLGMAGGTAIIAGGGAILGIAGSGSASMAVILSQTNSDYWIRQTTKMLTYCKCVLKDKLNNKAAIKALSEEISITIDSVEMNIKEIEQENCSLDKDVIKTSKDCLKYLGRSKGELEKLLNKDKS
ncbi:hypothetical protein [Pseudobutyrivibrio xylanivorans]|uniref:Uncharacterized protein n=1 Tax=Pseudobutyrivibrio xylanivorans TaxID=185007 RepID=A0A1G5S6H1_PSEXY|nr:hypothetical protein [Pseudobutyrivibrio xylanivorans]SCZ81331.1 hypothetical protein SAMN02910350_02763 [Pseudobutyrivibrio xylanivorans]